MRNLYSFKWLQARHELREAIGELPDVALPQDAATGKPLTAPSSIMQSCGVPRSAPTVPRVVTASADKTAQVWDATTGKPLTAPPQA